MTKTASAVLRVSRLGKGRGQSTSLKLYDASGNLIRCHTGPKANAVAGSLKKAGVWVVRL